MIIVDHPLDEWFLLRRDDDYFMDIASAVSYQPFSLVTKLNEEQIVAIGMFGRAACHEIAGYLAKCFLDAYEVSESDEAEIYATVSE